MVSDGGGAGRKVLLRLWYSVAKRFALGTSTATHPALDDGSARNQNEVQSVPTFDADTMEINTFEVEDADSYVFSRYFDQEEVFEELREYYDSKQYRFEVPADEIDRN